MTRILIYTTVFFNHEYIELFYLLLKSYVFFGEPSNNIDYLIICNPESHDKVKSIYDNLNVDGKIWCINIKSRFEASCSKLKIFDYSHINLYHKILYLDCNILITNPINKLFDFPTDNIIYTLQEGNTNHHFWGSQLFSDNNPKCSAFTTDILLFNNNLIIKDLFSQIILHINNHISNNLIIPETFEKPFIIYYAIKNNLYNNQKLINLTINNLNILDNSLTNSLSKHFIGQTICYFSREMREPDLYKDKIKKMRNIMNNIMFNLNTKPDNKNIIPEIKLINKCIEPCIKNKIFPLIGICVSYKYIDTLKFMLPINYNHFDKLFIVTQCDDLETINFCKKFDNVRVFLFNFKNNGKKFDKFGGLNMILSIAYQQYPRHWYLIIDSDIILPNNFIDILQTENLNKECMYGAIRNNIDKSSKLLSTIKPDHNNPFNKLYKMKSKYLLGCFQLFFKKNIFNKNFKDAGMGDVLFCQNNFNLFCQLNNIVYLHLGIPFKNWQGKTEYFYDDCNINLNQIYFNCNIKCKNIYYNKRKKILDSNKINNYNDIDKYLDVWTCSNEFRKDINHFFKAYSNYRIAEIGSYKGYTTRILSNIFKKVYAIDNSLKWTKYNKDLNKDKKNIEFISLDIYKDLWNIIPDVEVVLIDGGITSYECCKSDLYNSIKRFKSLKYIIFNDYGAFSGVKQIVNECLNNKMIIFEKYIGLNNVPISLGNDVVKNISEGIICKLNTDLSVLLNKTYNWNKYIIRFLESNKMSAFGDGKFYEVNKGRIKCLFGGKEHLVKFDQNYSSFISIRHGDFDLVKGNYFNNSYLINKTYTWEDSSILFLENDQMKAFGPGKYYFIEIHKVKCNFGGRVHLLEFNQDYSSFTSVREEDSNEVKGIYLDTSHLINKTYTWEDDSILFLKDNQMNAFGLGKYYFIKSHKVKCNFGGRAHLLEFNQDYSSFTSVREGDSCVVKGTYLDTSHLINKTYTWEDSRILFLENNQMNAFGPGKYYFIKSHKVKCNFGRRVHLLEFNHDYSSFTSVREGDSIVVKGFIV